MLVAFIATIDFIPCYGIEIYPAGYLFILTFVIIQAYSIIKYSKIKLATLIQNSPDGVLVMNRRGNITIINPNVDKFLGFDFSRYFERKIFEIDAENNEEREEVSILSKFFEHSLSSPGNIADKVVYFPLSRKYINLTSAKIKDIFADIVNILIVLTDITKQKILEEELREYQENLMQLVKERTKELKESQEKLKKAYEELKTVDQLKSNIISNVSHELRTPLTIIKSSLELLKELGHIDDDTKKVIELADQAVINQSHVIQNLTVAASLENERISLNITEIDLSDLILQVCNKFKLNSMTKKKEITIKCDIKKSPLPIISDSKKIELILHNLIINAIEYSNTGGKVTITAKKLPELEAVEICISDTGIGISEDKLDKIFDRLYQIDSSANRRFSGVGMGLFVVKELTRILSGEIRVESKVNEGSKFYLTLPIVYSGKLQSNL